MNSRAQAPRSGDSTARPELEATRLRPRSAGASTERLAARRFRLADITVRIAFWTTEAERIALLQAAGIPLHASGEAVRGFLFERTPGKFGGDSIYRWFDTARPACVFAGPEPEADACLSPGAARA